MGVNGQGGYLYNWTQDGGESSVAVQVDLLKTPLDAIGEVSFKTSNFSAEYSNGMAQFNVNTKSGTNQFHGDLFEFNQSTVFDARNAFQTTRPPIHWNNFGGSVGGPIRKDKAFFFFAYQRNPNHGSTGGLITVPTALMESGNLSGSDVSGTSRCRRSMIPALTPVALRAGGSITRTAFPGTLFRSGMIDPAALAILKYYPQANHPAAAGTYNSNNYYWNMPIRCGYEHVHRESRLQLQSEESH